MTATMPQTCGVPWCTHVHDGDAVHYGPLLNVQATTQSDKGRENYRFVEVQVTACSPTDDYRGEAPYVFLTDQAGTDGVHLLPVEARMVARALLEAADLAEGAW